MDKHDPEQVGQRLISAKAEPRALSGVAGTAEQLIVARIGVSKRLMLHHCSSGNIIFPAAFAIWLEEFEALLGQAMAIDVEPRGRFTRAYVTSAFNGRQEPSSAAWSMFSLSVLADPSREEWKRWLRQKRAENPDDFSDPKLQAARFSADGYWLYSAARERSRSTDLSLDAHVFVELLKLAT